jgi:hypothetical protein
MMTQLRDHDPDDDPIVVLPCGHALTRDTLDAHIGLDNFYARAGKDGGRPTGPSHMIGTATRNPWMLCHHKDT